MTKKEQPVCAYHPNKEGVHTCGKCGKKICFECVCVSFGSYVCEECDTDLTPDQKQDAPRPPMQKAGKTTVSDSFSSFIRNPKYSRWIVAVFMVLFLATILFLYVFIKNPPLGKLSVYRVAYYPVKSEGKGISTLLEEKGISAEWKSLENKLTQDGGYFVYFNNPETTGFKPIWYVIHEVAFTINKDSRTLCNSELSETTVFSEKGLTEEDISNYVYGNVR